MIRQLIILFLGILLLPSAVLSQRTPQAVGIEIQRTSDDQFFVPHELLEGETLYSLGRQYQVTLADINKWNPHQNIHDLKVGSTIKIPLNPSAIVSSKRHAEDKALYYEVLPQETLFRIARVYFDQKVALLKELNDLSSNAISPGQKLIVGYLTTAPLALTTQQTKTDAPPSESPAEHKEPHPKPGIRIDQDGLVYFVTEDTIETENKEKERYTFDSTHPALISRNGTAFWNKTDYDSRGYFVLHRHAKKNSVIQITNPMSTISINAKVIGELPFNLYGPEIDMVVSPELARALKVLDAKFFVETKYLPH